MNRTEEKKLQKIYRRRRKKHFLILILCIILFISMIYITDVSTSKMVQKSDDKHAIYIKCEKDDILRIDLVGETIRLYTQPLKNLLKSLFSRMH